MALYRLCWDVDALTAAAIAACPKVLVVKIADGCPYVETSEPLDAAETAQVKAALESVPKEFVEDMPPVR